MVSRRLPGQPFGDASGLELQPEEVLVIIAETLGTFWLLGAGTGVLQVFCLGSVGNYQWKLPPPPRGFGGIFTLSHAGRATLVGMVLNSVQTSDVLCCLLI